MDTPTIRRYQCDPHGDVILLLRDPETPFAVWEDVVAPNGDDSASTGNQPESTSTEPAETFNPKDNGLSEPRSIDMRVSSRHLILASSYFNRMLNGDWKESNTLQSDGCVSLEMSDWDIDAVRILMNIIHGRMRKVPETINLEMLAKIAVLVDYYDCLEVIEMWSKIWIGNLKSTVPEAYSRDLVLWLCISWVFQQSEIFSNATKVVMMDSTGPVQTMKLPIPERIVRFIDGRRQDYIEHIVVVLHGLVNTLCETDDSCTFACSSMRLGALVKQMKARSLYSPRPAIPFVGFSAALLTESVETIDTPSWCPGDASGDSYYARCQLHTCSLRHNIEGRISLFGSISLFDSLDQRMGAPNLQQFLL